MKTGLLTILCFAFPVTATAMPHASLSNLRKQAGPDCNQTSSNNGLGDLIVRVNEIPHVSPEGKKYDPRGWLVDRASKLGLAKVQQQLRGVVGDIFCPGISKDAQGNGTLISNDGTLLTNLHILSGQAQSRNLQNCFWQNKGTPFERINLDAKTYHPLAGETNDSSKDLAIVRLARVPRNAKPFRIDDDDSPMKIGDEIIMISSYQSDMKPSGSFIEAVTKEAIPVAGAAPSIYEHNPDLIVQSCSLNLVSARRDELSGNGLWSDCSNTEGSSGSPIFVLKGEDVVLKGVHWGGGKRLADGKEFTLDKNSPGGASFAYAIQLNRNLTNQIESYQAMNEKGRTSLADGSSRPGM